ncbi:hypothetical protein K501DRAFT_266882 [Backusella circina FSU 941]|nr:hypothetical protein K501DRAFT_266882 [Backusella circina FSU 941]
MQILNLGKNSSAQRSKPYLQQSDGCASELEFLHQQTIQEKITYLRANGYQNQTETSYAIKRQQRLFDQVKSILSSTYEICQFRRKTNYQQILIPIVIYNSILSFIEGDIQSGFICFVEKDSFNYQVLFGNDSGSLIYFYHTPLVKYPFPTLAFVQEEEAMTLSTNTYKLYAMEDHLVLELQHQIPGVRSEPQAIIHPSEKIKNRHSVSYLYETYYMDTLKHIVTLLRLIQQNKEEKPFSYRENDYLRIVWSLILELLFPPSENIRVITVESEYPLSIKEKKVLYPKSKGIVQILSAVLKRVPVSDEYEWQPKVPLISWYLRFRPDNCKTHVMCLGRSVSNDT